MSLWNYQEIHAVYFSVVSCNTFCQEKLHFVKIVHSDIKGFTKVPVDALWILMSTSLCKTGQFFSCGIFCAADCFTVLRNNLKNLHTGDKFNVGEWDLGWLMAVVLILPLFVT